MVSLGPEGSVPQLLAADAVVQSVHLVVPVVILARVAHPLFLRLELLARLDNLCRWFFNGIILIRARIVYFTPLGQRVGVHGWSVRHTC